MVSIGHLIAALLLLVAAVTKRKLGIDAEGRSLEEIASRFPAGADNSAAWRRISASFAEAAVTAASAGPLSSFLFTNCYAYRIR